MGRETKFLLALLATLVGVFFGVLSMKLLVPRPPVGAGPDVTLDTAGAGTNELVEPPSLSPSAAGPPTDEPATIAEATPADNSRRSMSRFTADDGDLTSPADAFVAAAVEPPAADVAAAAAADLRGTPPPPRAAAPVAARRDPFVAPATLEMPARQAAPPAEPSPAGVAHVASTGDSWWGLAERAYGDGRLYRALFAWNRTNDPRISLAPGTRL